MCETLAASGLVRGQARSDEVSQAREPRWSAFRWEATVPNVKTENREEGGDGPPHCWYQYIVLCVHGHRPQCPYPPSMACQQPSTKLTAQRPHAAGVSVLMEEQSCGIGTKSCGMGTRWGLASNVHTSRAGGWGAVAAPWPPALARYLGSIYVVLFCI